MVDDDTRERVIRLEIKLENAATELAELKNQFAEVKGWGVKTMLAVLGTLMLAYWERIKTFLVIGGKAQ